MSSFMAGVMVGALILGRLADKIGRRANMAITTLGTLIFNTGTGAFCMTRNGKGKEGSFWAGGPKEAAAAPTWPSPHNREP
jgi:MFS family permease